MGYVVDETRKEPAYMLLYEALRGDIEAGVYAMGQKLPSKRVAALDAGLSLSTVEHAYDLLAEEGYVEARERTGYFVVYDASRMFPLKPSALPLVKGNAMEEETFPFSVYAKTARSVLSKYGEMVMERSEWCGLKLLRNEIMMYLARARGIHVDIGQIVVGAGSEHLYSLVVQLLGRHRIFGLEDPSYERIHKIYRANGVRCDMLKMAGNGILSSELKRTPALALHVTPDHSYPSLATADIAKRNEYIAWAREKDAYIIEDDYASEYSLASRALPALFSLDPDHVIYMNTFTKTIAPSLRVGYMILPRKDMDAFREMLSFRSCSVGTFEQLVLAELLNNGAFERHVNRMRRKRQKEQHDRKIRDDIQDERQQPAVVQERDTQYDI